MPQEESPPGKPEIYLPKIPIEELPAYLGFAETEELINLNDQMVQAVRAGDWPTILALKNRYDAAAEVIADMQPQPLDRDKIIIGATVAVGLIYKKGGRDENYGAELQNAHQHAWNWRLPYVVEVLEFAMAAIGEKVETRVPWVEKPPVPQSPSENYLSELAHLTKEFEIKAKPVQVSLSQNHLIINDRLPNAAVDSPAEIWAALTKGQSVIESSLAAYRETLQSKDPDATIDPDTPLQVVQLGQIPREVLSADAFERCDKEHEFSDIRDVKEDLRPYWQAIQAAGLKPHVRLFAHRGGWYPVFLWSNSQYSFQLLQTDENVR